MMPDTESKKRWDKENTIKLTFKFQRKGDADILEYLEGRQKATVVKAALREYMTAHPGPDA